MCHSNESGHALNPTFPDTTCIDDSFQINPHWMSNSGVLNTSIFKTAWKTDKGSPVSPGQCSCTQVCDCNGCCAWLWLLNWLIILHILLIWYYLTTFCSHHEKKHLARKQCRTDDEVISAVEDFSRIRMRASIPWESKLYSTDVKSVWTEGENMLTNKPHSVKFDHRIIVSLRTFSPPSYCFHKRISLR